jgi:hypothetical protein
MDNMFEESNGEENEEIVLPDFFPKKSPKYYKIEPWQLGLSMITIIFVIVLLILNSRGMMEGTS